MNARDIIERLAALDEAPAAPEVEPDVAPDVDPDVAPSAPPAPRTPREPSPDPWTVPPDYEPGTFPHPKAGDESEAIEGWLEATQQPIQDWEWDGENLRLLLQDGTVETYTRQQLDEIGVFGEMAFAESLKEDEDEGEKDGDKDEGGEEGGEAESSDEPPFGKEEGGEPGEDAGGCPGAPQDDTIAAILGTADMNPEVVAGEPAQQLTQAVDQLVSAILGVVQAPTQPAGEPVGEPMPGEGDESSGELALAAPDERPDENYDEAELAKGIQIELEHTDDPEEAKKIAKDHLDEDAQYYVKLEQVEGK